jgi:hypothetical protein
MKPDDIEALRSVVWSKPDRMPDGPCKAPAGRALTTGDNMGVMNLNVNQPLACTQQNGELRQLLFFQYFVLSPQ